MKIDTTKRSNAIEIMDDFALKGTELKEALDKIAWINQLLGGNKLTLQGLQKVLVCVDKSRVIKIIDVGCGNGDMLRTIADFGTKNGYSFELVGIDANAFTVNHARQLSQNYSNISYLCEDIFHLQQNILVGDVILCTLTLHHFKDAEIEHIVELFYKNAKCGIVINDLHRSKLAYRLFQLLGILFNLNQMSKQDGQISILRGFKKSELQQMAQKLNFSKSSITWKWAFRYQWIIQKI